MSRRESGSSYRGPCRRRDTRRARLAQEAEPGVTGPLVGSQLRFEVRRDWQGFELPVAAEAAEPLTEPSLEVRLLDLQPLYLLDSSEPQAQGFGQADLTLEVACGEELQGGVDLFGVEAHPFPRSRTSGDLSATRASNSSLLRRLSPRTMSHR